MKKTYLSLLQTIICIALLCGCSDSPGAEAETNEKNELIVYAAASLTEPLQEINDLYKQMHPDTDVIFTFDSSGTLKTQIEEGAPCDLFISASSKQMEELQIPSDEQILLLENKVVLCASDISDTTISSFEEFAEALNNGTITAAIGNADVPVGQYTLKIFSYLHIDEKEAAACLSYGSNAKEVMTAVSEGITDCGILYATDAALSGVKIIEEATPQMCGQALYPAAILSNSEDAEAYAFLDFLQSDEARTVFTRYGFTVL